MTIDTDRVAAWLKTHLAICVPIACAAISWFAALRWQAACDKTQVALMIFYFSICAVSGITAACLTLAHINRLGFFNTEE